MAPVTDHLWRRWEWRLVISLTALGAVLRFYALGRRSIWLDDAYLYWFMAGDWKDLWLRSRQFHSAPPLFVMLMKPLLQFNDSEAGLRFLPGIMGVAGIPLFHLLARRILTLEGALCATAIAAISPTLIHFSREVREYSAVFFLSTASLLLLLRYLDRPILKRSLACGLLSAVGLWVHYSLGILAVGISIAWFIIWWRESRRLQELKTWAAGQVLPLAAGIGVLTLVFRYQFFLGRGQAYLSEGYWSGTVNDLFRLLFLQPFLVLAIVTNDIVGLTLTVIGLAWAVRRTYRSRWFVVSVTLAVVAMMLAIAKIYPLHYGRQSLYLLPLAFLLAGASVEWIKTPRNRLLAAGLFTILCALVVRKEIQNEFAAPAPEDLRPVVAYLDRAELPGDRIFVTPGAELAFRYYNRQNGRKWIAGTPNAGYFDGRTLELSLKEGITYASDLRRELSRPGRLWLVASHLAPVEPTLSEVLNYIGGQRRPQLVLKPRGAELYLAE